MYGTELIACLWPGDSVDAEDLPELKGGFSYVKR